MMATTIEVSVGPQFDALTKTRVARDDAIDARDLAGLWVSEAVGVEVKNGDYSALHHRTKAENAQSAAETAQAGAEVSASDAEKQAQQDSSFTDSEGDSFDQGAKGYAGDAQASAVIAETAAEDEANEVRAETMRDRAVLAGENQILRAAIRKLDERVTALENA